MKINAIVEVEKNKWRIDGDIDRDTISRINDFYTILFGRDDVVIQGSMSNVENREQIYIHTDESYEFNQLMLVDNEDGQVIAVIELECDIRRL